MQRLRRSGYRYLLGGSLISIAAYFTAIIYLRAPWQDDVTAFLVQPFALFVVPMLLVGAGVVRAELACWTYPPLPVLLVPLGIGMLMLSYDWPPPASPTAWEDAYTTLAVVESALRQFFVPLWLVFAAVLIHKRRIRRNRIYATLGEG